MNYKDCIDWLYSFEKFGIKLGLDRIKLICNKLGNPQKKYNIIHVGGTNGKGSVCHILHSILTKNGYKVGVYTSPHLQRFSERFTIDGIEISEKDVVLLTQKIKPIIEDMIKSKKTPTFFEIVTAMAFQYFKDKAVDYAIVEVGLGGRFDATNIVDPVLTIITNVTLEHQKILGKKIEDITIEKAGIIKENISIVTAATDKALEIIKNVSTEKNASISIIDKNSWRRTNFEIQGQKFLIKGSLNEYHVKTPIIGLHQGENIALSIAAIENLQMNGLYITDEGIKEGIENIRIPGRMEIAGFNPTIILDGAHNIAGMNALKKTLKADFDIDKLVLIIGILSDKNIKKMLEIIIPIADIVITTKSNNARAYDPNKIRDIIIDIDRDKQVFVFDKIKDAINQAQSLAQENDLICITGSLFTVGDAKDFLNY
jgi:dihydrofolate synthase/folylpolyglutamate synthase